MAPVEAGARKLVAEGVREFFLLEHVQRSVEKRSPEQAARIRHFVAAADSRLVAAESLTARDQLPAALSLYREAMVLVIRALLEARGIDGSDLSTELAFREVAALIGNGELPPPPRGFEDVRSLLTDPRPLAFDELSGSGALERRSDVEKTAIWLRGLVDSRTVTQIRWSRFFRIATPVVAILALLAWGISGLFAPKNIALGKPVELSSRRPQCPPGSGEAGLAPSGLVDGSKSGGYDICTNYEVRPWATIDLQHVGRISKVVVHNRGDCCWGLHDLPIVLDLSEDGVNFTEVARRTTPYSATDPWVVKLERKPAKVIRLRIDFDGPKELVLTEVEVYSQRL